MILLFGRIDLETLKMEDSGPKTKKRKFSPNRESYSDQTKLFKSNTSASQTRSKNEICYKKLQEN